MPAPSQRVDPRPQKRFQYEAKDSLGRLVRGELESHSVTSAQRRVGRLFRDVISVREAAAEKRPVTLRLPGRRVSSQELVMFIRHLQVLVAAGIPLHRALEALVRQHEGPLLDISRALLQRVETGWSLAAALQEQRGIFSPLVVGMVKMAEGSGRLVQCLDRLAEYLERADQMRRRILASLTYPGFLALACVGLVLLLVNFLLPRIEAIILDLGGELPFFTRMLLFGVDLFTSPFFTLPLIAGVGLLGYWLVRLSQGESPGRERLDGWLLRVPGLGRLLRNSMYSRVLFAWATVLEAGLAIHQGLELVADVADNLWMKRRLLLAKDAMVGGAEVATSLAAQDIFPQTVLAMIRVGEESGELPAMLRSAGALVDDDLENALAAVSAAFEPLVIAVMGVVIGIVALATAMPILNLIGSLEL